MKRIATILVLLLFSAPAFAAAPIQLWDDTNKRWINAQCDASGTLKVVSEAGTSSVTLDLPNDGDGVPYFSLSQVASDALSLFNAWFAEADLDKLGSGTWDADNNGLRVIATGTVNVGNPVSASLDSMTLASLTAHVDNFPATQVVDISVPASWTQSTLTASTSVLTLTTDAKCTSLMLQSLGSTTTWLTLDGSDPVVGAHGFQLTGTGTALCQQSFPIGGSAPVKYVASTGTLLEQVQSLKP